MKTVFLKHFEKDLDKLKSLEIQNDVFETILNVENALKLSDIKNIKKLKGYKRSYRIRIGDYRIGVFIDNDVVEFAAVAHRKDIYQLFP